MNDAILLEARGLSKSFDHEGQRIDVLQRIDLVLRPGERVAIIGSSGAGKSTLLHVLGTLDRPSTGSILFDGIDVMKLGAAALAEFRNASIGFMFQFHHLLPVFTALENVMMPLLIRRRARAEARDEAERWLEAVGLKDRMRHRPGELSGGEQQRVALARALVGHPRLLLADEPTGNLDSHTSAGIHALFEQMNTEHGTAMLLVTHNADLAARMPRCLRMRDGQLIEEVTA
ncbi:MAG: ABC transporter ATP-binding protein [Myxococcales bacterium]|nr:ABC transporter ATP-binding protein [Myxococcales bacterium]